MGKFHPIYGETPPLILKNTYILILPDISRVSNIVNNINRCKAPIYIP